MKRSEPVHLLEVSIRQKKGKKIVIYEKENRERKNKERLGDVRLLGFQKE